MTISPISLTVELAKPCTLERVKEILAQGPSVKLSATEYTTPVEAEGKDDVFVGRIRRDTTRENTYHLWLCSDNLRRGAAVDAVEIAGHLLKLLTAENKKKVTQ